MHTIDSLNYGHKQRGFGLSAWTEGGDYGNLSVVMQTIMQKIEERYQKPKVVAVRSGDTVRVSQKIKEGGKERTQVFEGLVMRTKRTGSHTSSITVRRIASGVGVEKSFLVHSPLIEKIEVIKRSKVRRNYLSYMRQRSGKSARLSGVAFDREATNAVDTFEPQAPVIQDDKKVVAADDQMSDQNPNETAAATPEPEKDKTSTTPANEAPKPPKKDDKSDKPA